MDRDPPALSPTHLTPRNLTKKPQALRGAAVFHQSNLFPLISKLVVTSAPRDWGNGTILVPGEIHRSSHFFLRQIPLQTIMDVDLGEPARMLLCSYSRDFHIKGFHLKAHLVQDTDNIDTRTASHCREQQFRRPGPSVFSTHFRRSIKGNPMAGRCPGFKLHFPFPVRSVFMMFPPCFTLFGIGDDQPRFDDGGYC